MHEYVTSQLDILKEEVLKANKTSENRLQKRINDLYYDHMVDDVLIGPGSDCEYKSVMAWCKDVLPKLGKTSKKAEEDIT